MRARLTDPHDDTGAVSWKLSQLRLVAAVAIDALPQVVRQLRSNHPATSERTADRAPARGDVSADRPRSDRHVA